MPVMTTPVSTPLTYYIDTRFFMSLLYYIIAFANLLKQNIILCCVTAGNTYIAGCTDPSYADKTCPSKLGFDDQEWVAIDHCGTDSNGDTDWGGCKNSPANETALTKLPNSSCDPYCATTLWVGGTTIDAYAVSNYRIIFPSCLVQSVFTIPVGFYF